ncbi:hypothetical protein V3474_29450, partial [Pseudomonas aeruginosa]|uniref:hypothetical protein n=1 Tax=Pseudomonas aeruginosa TaxID=287 RepID=UPI002F95C140
PHRDLDGHRCLKTRDPQRRAVCCPTSTTAHNLHRAMFKGLLAKVPFKIANFQRFASNGNDILVSND